MQPDSEGAKPYVRLMGSDYVVVLLNKHLIGRIIFEQQVLT